MIFGIDFFAFVIVTLASLTATLVVVGLYALGIRLLAFAEPLPEDADPDTPEHEIVTDTGTLIVVKPLSPKQLFWAKFGSRACFALSGLAVLFGVILIVPGLQDLIFP